MATTTDMIKELRQLTGAGVLDCKRALDETGGDMEKAAAILRERGLAVAAKKAEREVLEGRVEAYIHPGNKLASLIEVNCETDFVARTDEFIELCHDLAMQVAAANPSYVSREDVPDSVIEAERNEYRAQIAGDPKPEHIVERVIEGKLGKFYEEKVLLEQPFIKDETKTVQQLLTEAIAKTGENIVIRRFARFTIDR
ncbi:MAG TPA: translation elongation factor Ts [Chloroflexi bacterium]|nr:translation elongation factor Ts [Chloroflexota bacterium]